MSPRAIEVQGEALFVSLCATANGDLRAVITALSARVTLEDIAGETFDAALARAVGKLFERFDPPPILLPAPSA